MGEFLLSIASPELLSWGGFVALVIALIGEAGIWLIPKKWERLHAEVALAVLAAIGYAVERLGDDAIIDALKNRASIAESQLANLKKPRTFTLARQQFVSAATAPYAGQRYRAVVSQAADDGIAYWESI